jgi:hypothetical protein
MILRRLFSKASLLLEGLIVLSGVFLCFYDIDLFSTDKETSLNLSFLGLGLLSMAIAHFSDRCLPEIHAATPAGRELSTPTPTSAYWILPGLIPLFWRLYTVHNLPHLFLQVILLHLLAYLNASLFQRHSRISTSHADPRVTLLIQWSLVCSPILFPIGWGSFTGYALTALYSLYFLSKGPVARKAHLCLFTGICIFAIIMIPFGYSWSFSRVIDALHRGSGQGAFYLSTIAALLLLVQQSGTSGAPLLISSIRPESSFLLATLVLCGMRGHPGVVGSVMMLWLLLYVLYASLTLLISMQIPQRQRRWCRISLLAVLLCGLVSSTFHNAVPTRQTPFTERRTP